MAPPVSWDSWSQASQISSSTASGGIQLHLCSPNPALCKSSISRMLTSQPVRVKKLMQPGATRVHQSHVTNHQSHGCWWWVMHGESQAVGHGWWVVGGWPQVVDCERWVRSSGPGVVGQGWWVLGRPSRMDRGLCLWWLPSLKHPVGQ